MRPRDRRRAHLSPPTPARQPTLSEAMQGNANAKKGEKNSPDNISAVSDYGTSATYLAARLKRDRPLLNAYEKAGLSFKAARMYGAICAVFPIVRRTNNFGFDHHRVFAIQDLTDDQRADLLEKSSKNPKEWTAQK